MRVYLAGPEVFLLNAKEIGRRKKDICANYGLEGVFPLDADYGQAWNSTDKAFKIAEANEDLISTCDSLIGNITPFRGISADVGTVYEIGFAAGQKKPVLAYTNCEKLLAERTRDGQQLKHCEGLDQEGLMIEDFGLVENLMIDGAVHMSGFKVYIHNAHPDQRFTDLHGFEQCVMQLARAVL